MDPNGRVLFSADIEKCEEFIKLFEKKKTIIERKVFIFLCKLAGKVLQHKENALSSFGLGIETGLNSLRGKEGLPKTSATNLSFIGLLDNRVELDENIKPGSNKYFASLSAMASKLAYENDEFIRVTVEETWKMELLHQPYSFNDDRYEGDVTQAFMFHDRNANPDMIVVAFRGTEPFSADDWSTDLDVALYKLPHPEIQGKVHRGFLTALGLKEDGTWPKSVQTDGRKPAYKTITEELKRHLKTNHQTKFIVTGHSLGGALAILFPAVLALHEEVEVLERLEAVYTFGQPRVGDETFGKFMEEQFEHYRVKYYRFVYSHDVVPRLPFDNDALMYKHFGTCLYINSLYEANVVKEVSEKNYFDCGSIIPRRADAMWELVRSFLLPRMFGPDYKEGLLLKICRVAGLLFPGLPAHGPQDYINATRLATY